jgi:hypothetical protein
VVCRAAGPLTSDVITAAKMPQKTNKGKDFIGLVMLI